MLLVTRRCRDADDSFALQDVIDASVRTTSKSSALIQTRLQSVPLSATSCLPPLLRFSLAIRHFNHCFRVGVTVFFLFLAGWALCDLMYFIYTPFDKFVQKYSLFIVAITLSIANKFSKIFRRYMLKEICNKRIGLYRLSITTGLTTMWKLDIRLCFVYVHCYMLHSFKNVDVLGIPWEISEFNYIPLGLQHFGNSEVMQNQLAYLAGIKCSRRLIYM